MHLAHLFKSIVEKYPDNIALVYKDEIMTYADLDRRSFAISQQLQARGITVGGRVGLLFNDPVNFIISMLGVVKLSAIYVPFDNRDSVDNISSLCQLTQVATLLYDNPERDLTAFNDFSPYLVQDAADENSNHLAFESSDFIPSDIDYVLYIMFTSGTTSRVPKGVLINHSGVGRFISDNTVGHL